MKYIIRFFGLFLVYAICFILPGILFPFSGAVKTVNTSPGVLPLFFFVMSIIFFYLISRANLAGLRLIFFFLIIVYGLQTFMTQIETWYFWKAFPSMNSKDLTLIFIRSLVTMILFAPLAVLVTGKLSFKHNTGQPFGLIEGFIWKLPLLGFIYAIIYFIFGYVVAWQFEAVRIFYSHSPKMLPFLEQMKHTFLENPTIIPFQFLRGMLWAGLGVMLLNMLKRSKLEMIFSVGLCFGLIPTVQLIFSNPYMPDMVRLAHFIEISSSNCIFAIITVIIFYPLNQRRSENER